MKEPYKTIFNKALEDTLKSRFINVVACLGLSYDILFIRMHLIEYIIMVLFLIPNLIIVFDRENKIYNYIKGKLEKKNTI